MKFHIITIGIFIFLLSLSGQSSACGCSKPDTISDLKYYVHVFKGKIVSVERVINNGIIKEKVTFEVLELIKGPQIEQIVVDFQQGGTSCDLEPVNFKVNEIYLISTSEYIEPKGRFFNNYCNLRLRIE